MNRLILLTVVFMAPAVALSQTKTSKEIDGLVGPVHTVITVSVSYTKIDGVWTEGTKATTLVFTYDENGKDVRFGDGGGIGGSEGVRKYNDKGQELERDLFGPDNSLALKILFAYDDTGRVIEESEQFADGKLRRRHTHIYDGKGRETSLSSYDSDNNLNRKLTWTFDEKGNRTEWTESKLNGKEMALFERITYTYDDRGNVLLQTQYGNPEGTVTKQTFTYEFDQIGNWIKRERHTARLGSGTIAMEWQDVDSRSITYYPNKQP